MGLRRKYSAASYFNFLYSLAFRDICYRELAHELDNIIYDWRLPMDENRMWDGYDIRKYYLCDESGYLPDGIDIYDDKIFAEMPSVLEVMVGFANRIYEDICEDYSTDEWIWMWLSNLDIIDERGECDLQNLRELVEKWESGKSMFFKGKWDENTNLWDQCAAFLNKKR